MTNTKTNQNTIKLQKFLSQTGIASRRNAEALIASQKVVVNGQVASIGQRINPEKDLVVVHGKKVATSQELLYFLINKPKNVVSTTSDELGRETVLSLLPSEIKNQHRLYPVGRLDMDSEGLMLLTNDGELTNKLTHPRYQTQKTYLVLIDREPSTLALQHLERGVLLKEGKTSPAQVEMLYEWQEGIAVNQHEFESSIEQASMVKQKEAQTLPGHGEQHLSAHDLPIWLKITIHEGKYHQVKRMLERVGYDTLRLIRIAMGPFHLSQLHGKKVLQINI